MSTPGGKGHAPRQTRDDDAFREAWERIFGEKRKKELQDAMNQQARASLDLEGKDERSNQTE